MPRQPCRLPALDDCRSSLFYHRFDILRSRRGSFSVVTIRITLQHQRQAWRIVAYHIDSAQEDQTAILPTPLRRKFLSPEAAISYITRIVLGRLKHQWPDATGADVVCEVTVRSQE